jgi:protein-S-isoprenylcysteine O-methyltransferase Ste14
MLNKIILIAFIAFSIVLVLFIFRIIIRGISIFAKPPINPLAFITAKICAFSSCFFIPAGMIWPELRWHTTPEWLNLLSMLPFFSGTVIATIAMKKLGDDLIFGLPEGSIKSLKTDGIFRFSRNPLYLGFILLIVSSCLITPNPINFVTAIIAIAFHHMIILREEDYLLSKFGNEYHAYMKATGRYLLNI